MNTQVLQPTRPTLQKNSEVPLNISTMGNFFNAFVQGAASIPIDIGYAVGFDEQAKEWEDWTRDEFPTQPGVSSFLGNVAGGILPTVPAALIGGSGILAQAPKLLKLTKGLTLGTYALQSAGMAKKDILEEEQRTGEDISALKTAEAMIGYGGITLLTEHFGLDQLMKNINKVSPSLVKSFGEAIGRGSKEEAFQLFKEISKITAREAAFEGAEELTEQLGQNAVSKLLYDTDREILQDAGMSFLGGVVGGGLLHGIGIGAGYRSFAEGYKGKSAEEDIKSDPVVSEVLASYQDVIGKDMDRYVPVNALIQSVEGVATQAERIEAFGTNANELNAGSIDKVLEAQFPVDKIKNIKKRNEIIRKRNAAVKDLTDVIETSKDLYNQISDQVDVGLEESGVNKEKVLYGNTDISGNKDLVDSIKSAYKHIAGVVIKNRKLIDDIFNVGLSTSTNLSELISNINKQVNSKVESGEISGEKPYITTEKLSPYLAMENYFLIGDPSLDNSTFSVARSGIEINGKVIPISVEQDINNRKLIGLIRTLYALKLVAKSNPKILSMINHLKLVPKDIVLFEGDQSASGLFDPSNSTVTLTQSYKDTYTAVKTLAHELQHAYDWSRGNQGIYNFAPSSSYNPSSPNYIPWKERPQEKLAVETEKAAGKKFVREWNKGNVVNLQTAPSLPIGYSEEQDINKNSQIATYFQTEYGFTLAKSNEIDLIIKHLKRSGLVTKVGRVTDNEKWKAMVEEYTKNNPSVIKPGQEVYGMAMGTTIYLGPKVFTNTAGHELFHVFANLLGEKSPLIQKAYRSMRDFGYTNPVEALANLVGDMYYQRKMPVNQFSAVYGWLQDFWAEVKNTFGAHLTPEQMARMINGVMNNQGMVAEIMGMPSEWQPIDDEVMKEFSRLGLVLDENVDMKTNIARVMELFDEAKGRLSFLDDKEAAGIYGKLPESIMDLNKVTQELFENPESVNFEIQKVLEGRASEYNTRTNVAWYHMVETGKNKILRVLLGDDVNSESYQLARESLERVTGKMKDIIHPASVSGFNLSMWNNYQTFNNLIGHLKVLKTKLDPATYRTIMQMQTGDVDVNSQSGVAALNKLKEVAKENPKVRDYFYEYLYSSMLSNPSTHIINSLTNSIWLNWQIPHRLLEGTIANIFGREKGVIWKEFIPLIVGSQGARRRAGRLFYEMTKSGLISEEASKSNIVTSGLLSKFNFEIGSASQLALEKNFPVLGSILGFPLRLLKGADLYFTSIAFDKQLTSHFYRQFTNSGYENPLKLARQAAKAASAIDFSNEQGVEIFSKYMKKQFPGINLNVSKSLVNQFLDDSINFAHYSVFMDPPGNIGQSLIDIRNKIPLGRVFVPFMNTLMNVTKRGLEMVPGVGIPAYKAFNRERTYHKRTLKPYRNTTSDMIAKQIEGTIITAILMMMFDRDDLTAAVPINPVEREQFYEMGKLPWSFRVGKTWVQYRDIEPFSQIFAFLGSAYSAMTNAKDDATKTDMFAQTAATISQYLMDSTWIGGVRKLMEGQGVADTLARVPATLVPFSAFFSAFSKGLEGFQKGYRTVPQRPKDFYEAMQNNVASVLPLQVMKDVVAPDGIPTRLNVWGKEVQIEGGMLRQWLPVKWSKEAPDDVEVELAKLGVYPGAPRRTITIDDKEVELPEDFYREYLITFGNKAKVELGKTIQRESYKRATPERQIELINRRLLRVRRKALQECKREFRRSGLGIQEGRQK